MRKSSLLLLFAFLALGLHAQEAGDFPHNSEPGKCYAKCLIADDYEEVTERVVVKAASKKTDIIPTSFTMVTEQLVKKEGIKTYSLSQTKYQPIKDELEIKPESKRLIYVPAEYETVEEQVMVKEATVRYVPVAAVYETVTERVEIKPASKRLRVIPAEFKDTIERVMIKEASTRIERELARYETQTERIEVSPSATKWVKRQADRNCLSADPNDCLIWCLVEVPAQFKNVTKQVRVGCEEGWTDNGEDCTRIIDIPAEFENRSKRIVKTPTQVVEEEIPAEYKEITKQVLTSPATTKEEIIPAEYTTVKTLKIKTPATTREEIIPAEFITVSKQAIEAEAEAIEAEVPAEMETITRQVVQQAATLVSTDVPAEYETVTKKNLVRKGGFTEWREVLCPNEVTAFTIRQVQEALKAKGYDPGPLDNILGAQTKAALTKFQRDSGLPIGNLDLETLRALNIQF